MESEFHAMTRTSTMKWCIIYYTILLASKSNLYCKEVLDAWRVIIVHDTYYVQCKCNVKRIIDVDEQLFKEFLNLYESPDAKSIIL